MLSDIRNEEVTEDMLKAAHERREMVKMLVKIRNDANEMIKILVRPSEKMCLVYCEDCGKTNMSIPVGGTQGKARCMVCDSCDGLVYMRELTEEEKAKVERCFYKMKKGSE